MSEPEKENGRARLIGLLQAERDRLTQENAALREEIKQMRWAERRRKVEAERAKVEQAKRDSLHELLNPKATP